MTTLTLEDCKARILSRLQDAGVAGLTRSALGVRGTSNAAKAYREALSGLESALLIGNLGTRSTPRYVLREHYCPLELAYAHMEAKAVPGNPKLYVATELRRGLKGAPNDKAEEAIKHLVRDGKLLRLARGSTAFFLHKASLSGPVSEMPTLTRDRVLAAYREIVNATGLSNVLVEELRRRLQAPINELAEMLVQECRAGRAVPSRGDWLLASEATRAAAIHIGGQPHLIIRFVG
ncbi:MAG: hypothetical protein ACREXY_08225 [Gammaproteobacteria bacterium]